MLTNGDEWHLFDFAVGSEPLASFSLLALAQLLQGATTLERVEERLAIQPLLQQALAINLYYLDAQRWEHTDVFRQRLANPAYHRIASLREPAHVETLVQQIKQVLGSLRETVRAQFMLTQQRYEDYQHERTFTSPLIAPVAATRSTAIENIVQFGTAFRMDPDGQLRTDIINLLLELTEQFLIDGDISLFESEYLQRAAKLFEKHQISQASLIEKTRKKVHLAPPREGLDALKALLQIHYAYLQSLDEDYALSKKTIEAYQAWQASVRGVFSNPQDEFCLQTSYIHFVRLFFVRVCEDHALIPRRISDGPFARFELYREELLMGLKDTYLRLLEETYQRTRTVYHNFFGHQKFFDWFLLDEYTILALFDLLNGYDFQGLNADVLGRVYNEGYIETKERSEKGQFYTPPQVVDYMLDAIGIPRGDEFRRRESACVLEKSVGDLSCGSGTFLVAAATRKSTILRRLVAAHEVDPDYALQVLTDTFLGFDLNPFACYLAEMNLLIQCLPFLLNEQGQLCRSVDRFHIYCADSLEPTPAEQARAFFDGTATDRLLFRPRRPRGQRITTDEQHIISIKEAKGLPAELVEFHTGQQGLDYLLGNPPYVSAGESSDNLRYRNEVWGFGIYHLLYQRWDLFVPFFERNLHFLHPQTGRVALIVSNGIETEGYAERLRQLLSRDYRLLQIDFFPGLRLFQDAAVENTVVIAENQAADEDHEVIRRRHLHSDCHHYETLPPALQQASNGQIFRWRYDPILDQSLAEGSIPLCAIVYIGTGVEAQSKENLDPVINGQRQKLFTIDNVFIDQTAVPKRPDGYTDDGVLGDDIDYYSCGVNATWPMRNIARRCADLGTSLCSILMKSCFWARLQAATTTAPACSLIIVCRWLSHGKHWSWQAHLRRRASRLFCVSRGSLPVCRTSWRQSPSYLTCVTCLASSTVALFAAISPRTCLRGREKGVSIPMCGSACPSKSLLPNASNVLRNLWMRLSSPRTTSSTPNAGDADSRPRHPLPRCAGLSGAGSAALHRRCADHHWRETRHSRWTARPTSPAINLS